MAMKWSCGWVVAAMVAAGTTASWAQEVEPVKPKPPPTATHRPPDRPPKPPEPDRPTPPSVPTPEQLCVAAGGEWRNGQCDMAKPACTSAGKVWDAPTRQCRPKAPAACPDGTKREGESCVPVAPAPVPPDAPPVAPAPVPPDEPRTCETGMHWDGQRCVWDAGTETPPSGAAESSGGGSGAWRATALIGGGVLLGVGAVTGAVAFNKKGGWSDQCEGKECYASAQDDYHAGKLFADISTGTFIAGAVLMTAGLFLIPGGEEPGDKGAGRVKPSVGVAAGPGGGFVSARWVY